MVYRAQVKSCREHPNKDDAWVKANCASAKDIEANMKYIAIESYIVNNYFDQDDFDGNDVHPFMEFFYKPLSYESAQADVFFMSRNEVTKKDGLIGMEPEVTSSFYEVFQYYSYSRSTDVRLAGQTPWVYSAWFQESMNKKQISRKVHSVLDALAEVGGLVNILLLVVAVAIGWVQKFLFEAYLVS